VETNVRVTSVERNDSGYRIETDRGAWAADNVVIATGQCDRPFVPAFGTRLSSEVEQVVPGAYRNPSQLRQGGVLVVGASAAGVQLAEEIHRSGRPVTLAVGQHTRVPRQYRGRDIQWWLDAVGIWDQGLSAVRDVERARRQSSLQLIGSPEHRSLDLGALLAEGVRVVGRAVDAGGDRIGFAGDLAASIRDADERLVRLLRRIDEFIERHGMSAEVSAPDPIPEIRPPAPLESLDLKRAGIATVLWATGYRRDYSWLRVPVLDERGEIRHDGGITAAPGLYVLGLQFLRTRKSSFLDGVGADAAYLADHIAATRESSRKTAA
jgi:putative flavoprotein involved in K+ transport